jgi:3-oxosteroid 1-dehydrogenase
MIMLKGAPKDWDLKVDWVSVGSGIGGLTGAITAHDEGLTAVVLEKADKVGGTTAYSYGEVWVGANHVAERDGLSDSLEETLAYMKFQGAGFENEANQTALAEWAPKVAKYVEEKAGVRWKCIQNFADYYYPKGPGSKPAGRYLEVEPFSGQSLGEWQKKTHQLSPYLPNGITHDEIFGWGGAANVTKWNWDLVGQRMEQDIRTLGPGLIGWFVKAVLDRKIAMYTDTPVRELVSDADGKVIGVRAEREGREFLVKAQHGVLIATGGYDWNQELVEDNERKPEFFSSVFPGVEGDNLLLGAQVGARVSSINGAAILLGYRIPGREHYGKPLYWNGFDTGLPHSIVVNRQGKRFADESFYRELVHAVQNFDARSQVLTNYPPFFIFDQNYHEKYPLGPFLPNQEYPAELVVQAKSLQELAQKLGIDADGLNGTVKRFNELAVSGKDPDFHRGELPWANFMAGDTQNKPNPNMAPLLKAPFYGVQLTCVSFGANTSGLRTDAAGCVISSQGGSIKGLYAAGNAAALLDIGAGMQSGFSNCRGMTFGYLAAKHAASAN